MRFLFFIFLTALLIGCTNSSTKNADEKLLKGDFDFISSLPICACDSLENKNDNFYLKDELFTGTCINQYDSLDVTKEEKHIFEGKMHGLYSAFTPNGDTLIAKLYKNGNLINPQVGNPYTCNCDSLEFIENSTIERVALYGFYFTGKCYTYFSENDTLKSSVKEYRSGYLEGKAVVYDNQGNSIREENFEKGVKL